MTTLQIKLAPHSNILDGITLYEKIDPVALNKLINSDLLIEWTTEWKEGFPYIITVIFILRGGSSNRLI